MRILVTGSNGQLGSEIRELSKTDKQNKYFFTDIKELDITNKDSIREYVVNNQIEIIINCAAYTQVDKAEDEKNKAFIINAEAPQFLAEICLEINMTLFHISTDYVFDGNNSIPYNESHLTSPLGVYGETKLKGEELIMGSGCNYIIIRTSWLYSTFGGNFVKTIGGLVNTKNELKIVFDQVGTPTYARDLASSIISIINSNKYKNSNQIYHFSNEGVCSWYDFAVFINKYFGSSCKIHPCHSDEYKTKVNRPHYSVLDKSKIKRDFKLDIPYWSDSLKDCIEQLKINKK